jgi:hypothetical protein
MTAEVSRMKPPLWGSLLLFCASAARGATHTNCDKTVSFAVAETAQISLIPPEFATRWIGVHQKSYPRICFSQQPRSQTANFLIVFSTSPDGLQGSRPEIRVRADAAGTSVPGDAPLEAEYWGFAPARPEEAVVAAQAYTAVLERELEVFAFVYDQRGILLFNESRYLTSRQGQRGDEVLSAALGTGPAVVRAGQAIVKRAVDDLSGCYVVSARPGPR